MDDVDENVQLEADSSDKSAFIKDCSPLLKKRRYTKFLSQSRSKLFEILELFFG